MVNFWKPKTNKISKPSRLNPWSISLNKPARAFYGDSDGDGVMNMFDCQPHNKKKQGVEHDEEITGTRKQAMIDKEAYLRPRTDEEKREVAEAVKAPRGHKPKRSHHGEKYYADTE